MSLFYQRGRAQLWWGAAACVILFTDRAVLISRFRGPVSDESPGFEMKLAEKMSRLGTESAFEVRRGAGARTAGQSIIHLEIGEPDFPTPPHVVEAGQRALGEGWTKYGPTPGLPELRDSIAAYISRTRGIRVAAENVCVVPGGKPIMFFIMIALLEPGDEVIYPDPGFPIYESMIRFLGAVPVPVPLVEHRGFSFDLNTLRDRLSDKTKLVVLNSPANPTGGVTPKSDLVEMAALARARSDRPQRRDLRADLTNGAVFNHKHRRDAREDLLDGF
jgi:aspartate/methionine/tyrosine aminotransferase